MMLLYPMKIEAPLKDYIWGGTRLKTEFHKKTELNSVAESWELSCHKDGRGVIKNGDYAGKTLYDFVTENGARVTGKRAAVFPYFPMLIKLIDAAGDLSVQVHPDNEYALKIEGEYGKTELWYIVDANPGASLIYGFSREVTREEVRQRIKNETLSEVLNRVEAHPGDVFFIEAGTIHSIGAGLLIAEMQQSSNTTYRVYDYGRVGRDGKARTLHIEKALDVMRTSPSPVPRRPAANKFKGYDVKELGSCEFFTSRYYDLHGELQLKSDAESFHSVLVLDGGMEIDYDGGTETAEKGDSIFIPAGLGGYSLSGRGSMIISEV